MPLHSPEVQHAITLIREAIRILERSTPGSGSSLAQHLEHIEHGIPFQRKEAFAAIGSVCHPRALGDRFIRGMEHESWLDHLDALESACATAFTLLDREFSTLTETERLQHT